MLYPLDLVGQCNDAALSQPERVKNWKCHPNTGSPSEYLHLCIWAWSKYPLVLMGGGMVVTPSNENSWPISSFNSFLINRNSYRLRGGPRTTTSEHYLRETCLVVRQISKHIILGHHIALYGQQVECTQLEISHSSSVMVYFTCNKASVSLQDSAAAAAVAGESSAV